MPPRRAPVKRAAVSSRNAKGSQRLHEASGFPMEATTPTRKLEFGNGSGVTNNGSTLRVWEKDIAVFLASKPGPSLVADPLCQLRLGDREELNEHRKPAGTDSVTSSTPVPARSQLEAQRETTRQGCGGKGDRMSYHNGSPSTKKMHNPSPSGATVDDEEERVIIGGEVPNSVADHFYRHRLMANSPARERVSLTPRLIPTPDGPMCRAQMASQYTADIAPTLAVQDLSPSRDAGGIPQYIWTYESQRDAAAVTSVAAAVARMNGALPETIDDGCLKETPTVLSQSLPLTAPVLGDSIDKVSRPSQADDVQQYIEEEGEEKEALVIPPPLSLASSTGEADDDDDDDAPFFHRVTSVRARLASRAGSSTATSKPHYRVGMRVEGQWGRGWFGAVVTEEEKNGFVQIRWDQDGSMLHLKVKEVRQPRGKVSNDSKSTEDKPAVPPLMRATQLVELMDNETPVRLPSVENERKLGDADGDIWVSPSILTLYLAQDEKNYSADSSRVLNVLVERGAVVVMVSPSHLEFLGEDGALAWRQQMQRMFFFVLSEDAVGEGYEMGITLAHAMGVSAVSVKWLQRLASSIGEECQRVCIPKPQELLGQGSDTDVRWRPLSRDERFLGRKIVYLAGEDTDIEFLIVACGGAVKHQASANGAPSPHYVYVAPGRRAQIPPTAMSVALLEKSWLIHRIHEFFLALPPSQLVQESCGNAPSSPLLAGLTAGAKRVRQQQEEEEEDDDDEELIGAQSPTRRTNCGVNRTPTPPGDALEVVKGEDYYFRVAPVGRSNEAPEVALGRVVSLGDDSNRVMMRLYEVKHTVLRQNPCTGGLESHTTVYLGTRTANVSVEDLIFTIPVYVVDASQMRHVYTLESPPRGADASTAAAAAAAAAATTTAISVKEEEGVMRQQRPVDAQPSVALCPSGPPLASLSRMTYMRSGNQQQHQQGVVFSEILINGWRVRSGVDVYFHDGLPSGQSGMSAPVRESVGRVQMIQRVAFGVVLVVHKAEANSIFGGSKMVVITPDMVTGVV
ncbi:hypothetical protein DQ04_01811090 [Trypanosoma grayi]|uniref:hypothetical protein n=1 Tax=Trypanosoma grayi TaxID=71804 RepID=UPI0004F40C92|nr:hypothetical protein DQ04_01811090 [Trypanosoma grayi]KEG12314.1 hypothetical protein DQ04_01811090 [Trypanosoma grayi]